MIEHKEDKNGFKYIEITNTHASAKIALQGAHVFAYKAKNKPALLWLSSETYLAEGKAIRGGIPVCFPWFGKHRDDVTLPQHGFARTSMWKLVHEDEKEDGTIQVKLQLTQSPNSLKLWPYCFEVNLEVLIGERLSLTLYITNTDKQSFDITTALHTYLNVSNIQNIQVKGLEGAKYYDVLTQSTETQKDALTINAEIDRVYQTNGQNITLYDGTSITDIVSTSAHSLVVWNPWKEKAHTMPDMMNEGYQTMVCLETANAREDMRVIKVGETYSLSVVYIQN